MSMPIKPPPYDELVAEITADPKSFVEAMNRLQATHYQSQKYLHWDTLIHLTPPAPVTHKQWWLALKIGRKSALRELPLMDARGRPLTYSMPDAALELLHFIDQHASGEIAMPEVVLEDEAAKRRYLVNSLIEEAIRSSQLEGATTTRQAAKEMIRSGREPKNRSERMILNNYRAMQFMHEMTSELTPKLVLELQRILTEGTLDNPDAAGRLQRPDEERVVVWDSAEGAVLHSPPPAEQLKRRLDLMCKFANRVIGGPGFMHPVVRAILLHFWLAYDHPFEDGNGRTARALFYWSMRTQGYWLTEYLSISRILRQAPSKYSKSFLLTETDDGDATYFIVYQLEVIARAIKELRKYLQRKMQEVREFESVIRRADEFNHRQLDLLRDAVRHPMRRYTIWTHARSHRVSHQSARNDLLDLINRGLLSRKRIGRAYSFTAVQDLASKLSE